MQLVQLPCQPNVVTLLEGYLKYLARNNFSDNKPVNKKSRQPEVIDTQQLEKRFDFVYSYKIYYYLFIEKIICILFIL